MPASPDERIRATLSTATAGASLAGRGRLYALGWATVDLDRAARELSAELGLAADEFAPAADSLALGARCRVAHAAMAGDIALAILEPSTEGRLAGMLARLAEGPAVIWSVADDTVAADRPAATPGPFGPERLMPGGPIRGLRWFLIGPGAGTIPP
jgi:hypothetical protein